MKEWHGAPPRSRWAALVVLASLVLLAGVAHATSPPLYPGVTGPAHDPATGGPHDYYQGQNIGTASERYMPGPRARVRVSDDRDAIRLWRLMHWTTQATILRLLRGWL